MYLREDVLGKSVAIAGSQILDNDGNLNRQALAKVAFSDPKILNALNQLIHPLVREDFAVWAEQYKDLPYIIHEAAIIFESGFGEEFDLIIHVSCPEEISIERIEKRDHLPREMILKRMRYQLPDTEKESLSDFVILNDGNTLVIPQVLSIHQILSKGSA